MSARRQPRGGVGGGDHAAGSVPSHPTALSPSSVSSPHSPSLHPKDISLRHLSSTSTSSQRGGGDVPAPVSVCTSVVRVNGNGRANAGGSALLSVSPLHRVLFEGTEFLKFGRSGSPHYKRVCVSR